MNERIALPARRVITPVTAFLIGIALLAAVALGFGLRAWTEDSSPSSTASTAAIAPTHETLNARDEATLRINAAHLRSSTFAADTTTAATPQALRERSYR